MTLDAFLQQLKAGTPLSFEQTLETIEAHYSFTATAFRNGDLNNAEDENQGSCRVFAFGRLNDLTEAETLACFGQHYRDVLASPGSDTHRNIRNFIKTGWQGVELFGSPLTLR